MRYDARVAHRLVRSEARVFRWWLPCSVSACTFPDRRKRRHECVLGQAIAELCRWQHCPACGRPLQGAACAFCGVSLTGATARMLRDQSEVAALALAARQRTLEELMAAEKPRSTGAVPARSVAAIPTAATAVPGATRGTGAAVGVVNARLAPWLGLSGLAALAALPVVTLEASVWLLLGLAAVAGLVAWRVGDKAAAVRTAGRIGGGLLIVGAAASWDTRPLTLAAGAAVVALVIGWTQLVPRVGRPVLVTVGYGYALTLLGHALHWYPLWRWCCRRPAPARRWWFARSSRRVVPWSPPSWCSPYVPGPRSCGPCGWPAWRSWRSHW